MAYGMRIWNDQGQLVFDTTTRACRVLGTISTGTADGSIVDPGFATGTAWWSLRMKINTGSQYQVRPPLVSVSGNTLSWAFPAGTTKADNFLTYGIY